MHYFFTLLISTALAGCGTQVALSGQARMDYLKSIKAYGDYFTKPGMTKESWREDWVACGGLKDGTYVAGPRLEGETADFAASSRRARQLDACMAEKGYTDSSVRP